MWSGWMFVYAVLDWFISQAIFLRGLCTTSKVWGCENAWGSPSLWESEIRNTGEEHSSVSGGFRQFDLLSNGSLIWKWMKIFHGAKRGETRGKCCILMQSLDYNLSIPPVIQFWLWLEFWQEMLWIFQASDMPAFTPKFSLNIREAFVANTAFQNSIGRTSAFPLSTIGSLRCPGG